MPAQHGWMGRLGDAETGVQVTGLTLRQRENECKSRQRAAREGRTFAAQEGVSTVGNHGERPRRRPAVAALSGATWTGWRIAQPCNGAQEGRCAEIGKAIDNPQCCQTETGSVASSSSAARNIGRAKPKGSRKARCNREVVALPIAVA